MREKPSEENLPFGARCPFPKQGPTESEGDAATNIVDSSSVDDIVAVASSSSNDNGDSSAFDDAGEGKMTSSNAGDSCTCMSSYESYLANRYYYTPLQRYFPSAEYTYCSVNDSVCSACISEWQTTFASMGSAGPSTYCTGANGCVCVADCEVQDWEEAAINYECNLGSSGSGSSDTFTGLRVTISVVIGVAVALLLAFATWTVRRFVRQRSYSTTLQRGPYVSTHARRRPQPQGPQLTLGGWNSLRQKLIDAENGFMNGEPVTLQRDVGDNTAAPANETATVIHVEEGCKRPRTCYDCLNVQVSSGECAIMPNGMCVNLADYSNYLNQQQEFGNYYKYYASNQYTYCSADDSACSACSSKWVSDYTSMGSIDSTYCTGLDGCLCLARCELPDWQASITTEQCTGSASGISLTTSTSTASRIGFALAVGVAFGVLLGLWGIKLLYRGRRRDRNPGVPGVYETRTVRRRPQGPQLALTGWKALREKLITMEQAAIGGDAVNMQEESLEDGGGYSTVNKTTSSNAGDSCTWYARGNCTQPRTGYDCLNVLLSTDECVIDPNGACVSMSVYEEYVENRQYYEPPSRYFPASNYTYCSVDDSVCSRCIAEWTSNYESTGSAGSTTHCTGLDGCVCVADCEVSDWQQTVIAHECGNDSDSAGRAEAISSGARTSILIGTGIGVGIIFTLLGIRRWPGSIPRPPLSGPQLDLTGWKLLREKLIETEHEVVKGDTVSLDVTARRTESLAGPYAVMVEVGQPQLSDPPNPLPN
ncbi:hypothetical protein BBP00_00008871 [Phytophthora kernoviae]|uniref:Uncharacterized protein n=1 Tax=Phytophthora kernoviae TaxID=325452 RepID=A0A3F2RE82_9STRA|nr:hypothetical protein BBP00_00008871 [Phytophthora kernoviae]